MTYSVKTKSMIVGSTVGDSVRIIFNPKHKSLYVGDSIRTINEKKQGIVAQVYKIENLINNKTDDYCICDMDQLSEISSEDKNSLHIAFCKINFSIIENKWVPWRGNLPSIADQVDLIYHSELITHIIGSKPLNPINMGCVPNNNSLPFELEASLLERTTLVIGNKTKDKTNLVSNLQRELLEKQAKILIIDPKNNYTHLNSTTILEAGKNFKLSIKEYGISNFANLILSQIEPALKARLENYFYHIIHNTMSTSKDFISLELIKNTLEQEQNRTENQQTIAELNILKNKIINIEKQGVFANTQEDCISIKTQFDNSNSLVLNLYNLSLYWQKIFLRTVLRDLADYESCPFVFYEDIHKYIDQELALEILYKIQGPNNFFITNYDADIPQEIFKEADNFFLFKTTRLETYANLYNNLNTDNNLLKHLLKLLTENNIVLYGELTNYYPLIIEPAYNCPAFSKNKHFGVVGKYISETGDIIYSYKNKDDITQLRNPEPETEYSFVTTLQESDHYIKQEPVESIEGNSNEEEYEEFLDENDLESPSVEEITESIQEIEEIEEDEKPETFEYIENIEDVEDIETEETTYLKENDFEIEEIKQPKFLDDDEDIYFEPAKPVLERKAKEKTTPKKLAEESLKYPKPEPLPDQLEDIPIYSTSDIDREFIEFNEGDNVYHDRYGHGVINRIIATGEKKLCSIQFENFGRRLLDPNRGLKKTN